MATFKNKGGEFRRPSGAIVRHGDTFTTTAREDTMQWPRRHMIGIRFVPVEDAPAPAAVALDMTEQESAGSPAAPAEAPAAVQTDAVVEKAVAAEEPKQQPVWTAKISPEQYLARFGSDAPQSALARAVIAATKE